MVQTSSAKVKVKEIKQVGIAVKDIQKMVESYWNILGIGPWEIRDWGSHVLNDRTYHGKPSWAREKIAHAYLGDLELELVQPVEGDSVYQDWIDEHGEGLHHLKFLVDDLDGTVAILAEQGFPSLQGGHFGDPKEKSGFNYIDIKPLHTIWEPVKRGKTLPVKPIAYYPEDSAQTSSAKVKVKEIKQVGIAVKDIQKMVENYWNILGIGPWEIRDWGSHVLNDRTYHGKPSWAREKIAHAYLGDLELELVQPVEGDSVYQDWIDEHGEGLHHLKFLVDDLDGTVAILAEQGFPSLQGGHFGDPKEKSGFNYIDIKPLHTIWEPVKRGKTLPVKPIAYYPEDSV